MFSNTFKHEDVGDLKAKMARIEPVTDQYIPLT